MAPLKTMVQNGHPRRDSPPEKKTRPLRWRTPIPNPKTHGRVPGCATDGGREVEGLGYLEDQTHDLDTWFNKTMVIVVCPLRIWLWGPLPNGL